MGRPLDEKERWLFKGSALQIERNIVSYKIECLVLNIKGMHNLTVYVNKGLTLLTASLVWLQNQNSMECCKVAVNFYFILMIWWINGLRIWKASSHPTDNPKRDS